MFLTKIAQAVGPNGMSIILSVFMLSPFVAFSAAGQNYFGIKETYKMRYPMILSYTGDKGITWQPTMFLITYGAVWLSFFGGPHWGFSLGAEKKSWGKMLLIFGMFPAVISFIVLMIDSLTLSDPKSKTQIQLKVDLLGVGALVALLFDLLFFVLRKIPFFYVLLRLVITGVMVVSLQSLGGTIFEVIGQYIPIDSAPSPSRLLLV